jgi:hypothetical protein
MNRPQQAVHICFYSNRCEWSKAFIQELSQTPYKGEFRFICADPSPTRQPLPSWLKKVPTLVISGEPNPRTDSDVMNWLYERKMKDGGGSNGAKQGVIDGPQPLVSDAGNAFGDSYSMINMDTSAQGNGGNEELGNFYGFSMLNSPTAVGTKEGASYQMTNMSGKRSKKEEMLDQQLESYMKQRDLGVPQRPRPM